MKIIVSIVILNLFFFNAFAQRRQNVYFFKQNGKEVKHRDSADYIRIIREPDSGKVHYELTEYYQNNALKRTGEVSSFDKKLALEGKVITYYNSGPVSSLMYYDNNRLIDTCSRFYSNGQIREIRYYDKHRKDTLFNVIQIFRLNGQPYLDEKGSGFIKTNISDSITIEGSYLNGRKNGLWKEYNNFRKENLEEEYVNGVFQSGICYLADGTQYKYSSKLKVPEFNGGIKEFYKYLARNLKYPDSARENNIQGSVLISFTVTENGDLNNPVILRSVSPDIDEEALRVIKSSPKWSPGLINGKPSAIKFSVPVQFSLKINTVNRN